MCVRPQQNKLYLPQPMPRTSSNTPREATCLEREDKKMQSKIAREKHANLPLLRRKLARANQPAERAHLATQIKSLESSDVDYLCQLGGLLKSETDIVQKQRDGEIKKWELEMQAQSMAIHSRQQMAGMVCDAPQMVRICFKGRTKHLPAADEWFRIHVNTTLPQLSMIVHEIVKSRVAPADYVPQIYHFWIVDPFSSTTPSDAQVARSHDPVFINHYPDLYPTHRLLVHMILYSPIIILIFIRNTGCSFS